MINIRKEQREKVVGHAEDNNYCEEQVPLASNR
ncbi:hypothetical protein CPS_4720 [Colwellia psychrerythraea 34H]|uniref:Uncharacterized protein n=1 Tax=Colwellia psychrerythraea (strain 34H / ATCC BAA-681) TaxID=167879 RepID=Q47V08_COLP3|nr:hypothetical protein CPS_4720 [Colwellia psychrerythraea 34H]